MWLDNQTPREMTPERSVSLRRKPAENMSIVMGGEEGSVCLQQVGRRRLTFCRTVLKVSIPWVRVEAAPVVSICSLVLNGAVIR